MGFGAGGRYWGGAVKDGTDKDARGGMMLASYYGGICLGPVNTAAGHALAYPLGTKLKLPHGLANALIFPHVLGFNQPVCPDKTNEVLIAGRSGTRAVARLTTTATKTISAIEVRHRKLPKARYALSNMPAAKTRYNARSLQDGASFTQRQTYNTAVASL